MNACLLSGRSPGTRSATRPPRAARLTARSPPPSPKDGILLPFLIYPAPGLLERHGRGCARHAALTARILGLLPVPPGRPIEGPAGHAESAARQPAVPDGPLAGLIDPLSQSELRVLRYLPTHLSRQEIAGELYVSPNTVKTHMRHLYAKLGTHRRAEAVQRARALGLLAPSPRVPSESQPDLRPARRRSDRAAVTCREPRTITS